MTRPPAAAVIRAIYAACLLGATYNHAVIVLTYGVLTDYGGRPWPVCAFWTCLTLADPAVAALLFLRPRWGVAETAAIIFTDVVINAAVTWGDIARFGPGPARGYLMLAEQCAFAVFVAVTARRAAPAPQAAKLVP